MPPIIIKANHLINLINDRKSQEAYDYYLESSLKSYDTGHLLIKTIFFEACKYQADDLAKYFIKKGCDVNWLDYENYTIMSPCLHLQIINQSIEMVKFLLEHGADPYIEDLGTHKLTAMHHCIMGGNLEIACTLIETSKSEHDLNKFKSQIQYVMERKDHRPLDNTNIDLNANMISKLINFIEKKNLQIKLKNQINYTDDEKNKKNKI